MATNICDDDAVLRLKARIYNNRLIKCREDLGLSATEAARAIGISYTLLLRYENMSASPIRRGTPGIRGSAAFLWSKSAIRIAEFYGADPQWIFPDVLQHIKKNKAETVLGERHLRHFLAETGIDDTPPELPSAHVDRQQLRQQVETVLHTLTPKEEHVLRQRFFDDMTYEQIAEDYELSTERIRQIETKALRKLRWSGRVKHLRPCLDDDPGPCGGESSYRNELRERQKEAGALAAKYNQDMEKATTEEERRELTEKYTKESNRMKATKSWLFQIIKRVEGL